MTGSIEKLTAVFSRCNWLLQWLILSLLALLLYIPVIGNYFVNDDFVVLRKVCLEKELNTDGFFRPLSDISIYGNYLLSGFNAVPYRITSILIHALNALLLFRFALHCSWTTSESLKQLAAILSALFFLSYPFHNEPVAWLLGRASLLASTFAFAALAALAGSWRDAVKMPVVAICYFIAMTGYETVMVLPAIIFVWLLMSGTPFKKIAIWMALLALVLLAHFIIRVQVSGSVTGEYGGRLIQWDIAKLVERAFKVTARLFIPPDDQPSWLPVYQVEVGLVVLVLIAGFIWFWKRSVAQKTTRKWCLALAVMLFFSLLAPFMVGVSTHTSENDRLLYFPSFFLCLVIAIALFVIFNKSRRWLLLWVAVLLWYNISLLNQNNINWWLASRSVTRLLDIVKTKPAGGKLYIVNMPEDIRGAYVFRVGLKDALIVNGIDTAGLVVVNHFDMQFSPRPIDHEMRDEGVLIIPDILVTQADKIPDENKYKTVRVNTSDRVVYWNRYKWILLNP